MNYKSPAFEKIYEDYLSQLERLNFDPITDMLGVEIQDSAAIIPFFGKPYRVSAEGIVGPDGKRPSHSETVVLCKYLLLCPETEPEGDDWVTYKDFRDAAPFVQGFKSNAELPISRHFSGKIDKLKRASERLGGYPPHETLPYQLSRRFDTLPKVPVLMLFNDEDEEFPAQCSLLFQRRASGYLDMECLALIGWLFSDYLFQLAESLDETVK